jgi:acyl-CoA thioester hydrolase
MTTSIANTTNLRVRYQETDQMSVAHHSVYFIWFEAARTELIREHGLSYKECEERGWLLPLIESGCRYLQPARYDDQLSIETLLLPEDGAIFHFSYNVRNNISGEMLAEGFTKHVCIDRQYRINRKGTKELRIFLASKSY